MFVIIKELCCCLFFYFVLYILILCFLFFGIFVLVYLIGLIKCDGYFCLYKKLVRVDFFVIYDYGVNIFGYVKC